MTTSSLTRNSRLNALYAAVHEHFVAFNCDIRVELSELTLTIPCNFLLEVSQILRDNPEFHFEQLIDLCGVDYSALAQSEWETDIASYTGFGRSVDRDVDCSVSRLDRFSVVYHLLSLKKNQRLRIRVYADNDHPVVDSVVPIWASADWFEREAFDLYGILFRGHPDLRRILTDYGFIGHPFRKDFPLNGQVEMCYDSDQRRVIYQPVSIKPRVLVPRVIREDSRYVKELTNA
jgi:NADH-quinone oxidoreductase subunit C